MPRYGYVRVSVTDQDFGLQMEALRRAGCDVIREEKRTGNSKAVRPELATLITVLRTGDTLIVTRIDRLARSLADLEEIVRTLAVKGVALKATEQPIDTSTAAGKTFLDLVGIFAAFDRNLQRERQMEGIAKAKAEGVYKGRPASIEVSQVRALRAKGLGATDIAKKLGIGRASVYRVLGQAGSAEP